MNAAPATPCQEPAVVLEAPRRGRARVLMQRSEACQHCDAHRACLSMRSHRLEIEVEDPLGSAAGDQVLVTLPLGGLLGASALVYLLPAVLLLLGAVAGRFASPVLEGLGTDPGTLLGAGAGLLVGLGLARLADRRWGQTRRFRPHILARTSGDRPCHRPSPRQPDQEA